MHTTFQQGASATFKFNGTGVWLFGGMRSDYGSLSLQIDGKEVNSRSAQANLPTFQQVLASAMNLTMGEHTAVLTATTGGPIDLDSVTFETQIGSYPYVHSYIYYYHLRVQSADFIMFRNAVAQSAKRLLKILQRTSPTPPHPTGL